MVLINGSILASQAMKIIAGITGGVPRQPLLAHLHLVEISGRT